jgi:phosphatidylserine decarboxylase
MRIDPAGWPFVLGGITLALVLGVLAGPAFGLPLFGLSAFFLFFFRDPDRRVDAVPDAVLSPADGRVMVAGAPTAPGFSGTEWKQISIFLSPLDVHVNRMPVGGRVLRVEYHPGRFLPAYRDEAAGLNEFTEVVVDREGQSIVVRQIVGILARRIVCRLREGDLVKAGDRFGVMKFGSRMDVFLPASATLSVRVGERVVGGVSVLARLGASPSRPSPDEADASMSLTPSEA